MASTQHPAHRSTRSPQLAAAPCVPRVAAIALAVACALGTGTAAAMGSMEIISRAEGRTLPVYAQSGRQWIVGTPGQEYGIRVCNTTGERVLAVMSVDGVNIVSGETASPSQSGYVLSAHECYEINGWRKSNSTTAAFYFTELPDAYATRTGRPDNVGVIGVALFKEKPQRAVYRDAPKLSAAPAREADARPGEDGLRAPPAIGHGAAGDAAGDVGDVGQRGERERERGGILMAMQHQCRGEERRQPRPEPEQLPVVEGVSPDGKHAAAVAPYRGHGGEQRFPGRPCVDRVRRPSEHQHARDP